MTPHHPLERRESTGNARAHCEHRSRHACVYCIWRELGYPGSSAAAGAAPQAAAAAAGCRRHARARGAPRRELVGRGGSRRRASRDATPPHLGQPLLLRRRSRWRRSRSRSSAIDNLQRQLARVVAHVRAAAPPTRAAYVNGACLTVVARILRSGRRRALQRASARMRARSPDSQQNFTGSQRQRRRSSAAAATSAAPLRRAADRVALRALGGARRPPASRGSRCR